MVRPTVEKHQPLSNFHLQVSRRRCSAIRADITHDAGCVVLELCRRKCLRVQDTHPLPSANSQLLFISTGVSFSFSCHGSESPGCPRLPGGTKIFSRRSRQFPVRAASGQSGRCCPSPWRLNQDRQIRGAQHDEFSADT